MNTDVRTDIWISCLRIVLGLIAAMSAIGTIILMMMHQPIPGILATLGVVAGAGLVRLLISPLNRELSG